MNEITSEKLTGTASDEAGVPLEPREVAIATKKSWIRPVLMLIFPLLLIAAGGYYWLSGRGSVSTDNAAVKQDIVSVSSQVAGQVVEVAVANGSIVKRGDLLFRIDPAPYRVALEQAEAQLAAARLQTSQLRTQSAGTSADIGGATAKLAIDQRTLARQVALLKRGFTTRVSYDQALADVQADENTLADAHARAANAGAALAPGEQPSIAQALAAVDQARLDLSRTDIKAPMDGTIANADSLQVGQMAATGIGLLSLVHSKGAWVEANFKESDLDRMVPGQRAKIQIDAYAGTWFNGHVQSVGAGTGSEFALIPAQNANGNWVKVTQRVPVQIAFDGTPSRPMISGLSSTVTVYFDQKD